MFRNHGWFTIILLVIISALIIGVYSEHLLSTALGSVFINVVSGFYFIVIVVVIFGTIYKHALDRLLTFFGVQPGSPLQVFISTHSDAQTRTNAVETTVERQAADELQKALTRNFPETLDFWAERFGFSPQAPQIVVKGSPLDRVSKWAHNSGVILIGGPTRNSHTDFVMQTCNPPLSFDDEKKVFLIRRTPQEPYQELENSRCLAIVEKLRINNRVVIIAFGFGEIETRLAVRHLIAEWKVFAHQPANEGFARLLLVTEGEQVQIQEELKIPAG